MNNSLEYWKKRCELAERVIECWESYHTANNAWTEWMNFQSSGDIAVSLPKPVIDAPGVMTIPHPMHDNFRAKYPLVDDVDEPTTEVQKEKAIHYGDIKLDSMGGTIGYRVHEKDFENEQQFRLEKESSFPKHNSKMSFADFAKAYFPDNEISVHHKAIIEKLEEVAGTPSHLIMQGVRPINWYKILAAMHETVIKLKEGKKCSVAMFGKATILSK